MFNEFTLLNVNSVDSVKSQIDSLRLNCAIIFEQCKYDSFIFFISTNTITLMNRNDEIFLASSS